MIRLNGNDLIKRIIGRQFENRPEVLADVTSVSYGDVGLKFRSDGYRRTIEPTVDSSNENTALLGIYMRTSATGLELIEEMQKRLQVFSSFDTATREGEDLEIEWHSINVVYVQGNDAQDRCRRLAWRRTKIESLALMSHTIGNVELQRRLVLKSLIRSFNVPPHLSQGTDDSNVTTDPNDCKFFNTTFLKGPGVSPVLTATESLDHVSRFWFSQQYLRYSASLLCLSLNLGIIIINGFLGDSLITLSFIIFGIAGSFASSWITATLIYRATDIYYFSLSGLQVLCAGFFSDSEPDGIGLTYLPSTIAISTASQFSQRMGTLIFTVFISAASFCMLYLGLRSAPWWVPLAMLGNVAFATCIRAVLGYDINVDPSRSELASRFSRYRRKAVLCHLLAGRHENDKLHSTTSFHIAGTSSTKLYERFGSKEDLAKRAADEKMAWSILSFAGTANSCPGNYIPIAQDLNIAEKVEKTLLYNAYNISLWLHKENLAPVGISRYGSHKANYVASEFLGTGGIWHQPFEVLLPLSSKDTDLILDDEQILEWLRMWITESLTGNHGLTSNCFPPQYSNESPQSAQVSHVWKEFFCNEEDMMSLQELVKETAQILALGRDPPRSSWTSIWSNKAMLWMAIKIIFASRSSWMDSEEFTRLLKQGRDRANPLRAEDSSLDDEDVVIHCLSRTGTLGLDIEGIVPCYVGSLVKRELVARNIDA